MTRGITGLPGHRYESGATAPTQHCRRTVPASVSSSRWSLQYLNSGITLLMHQLIKPGLALKYSMNSCLWRVNDFISDTIMSLVPVSIFMQLTFLQFSFWLLSVLCCLLGRRKAAACPGDRNCTSGPRQHPQPSPGSGWHRLDGAGPVPSGSRPRAHPTPLTGRFMSVSGWGFWNLAVLEI